MIKKSILPIFFLTASMLATAGCGNLSPKDNLSPQMKQQIDKIQGNQQTLENNQDALKLEVARLQNALDMANSNNNKVQQGWLNIQSDGIFVGAFALITISLLLFYMYKSNQFRKTAEVLAQGIKDHNDPVLKERIMAAAWGTSVEKRVYRLI